MAVLLLLPEGKNLFDKFSVSEQNSAYIKSEKSSLNVKLKIINGKSEIISADTVNVIYPVGKIDSIKYNFKLLNNNISNQIYSSKSRTNQSAFEIIENKDGLARFEWFPQKINNINRNFEVVVEAEIYSMGNKEPNMSSARFAVNTYYVDDAILIANNSKANSDSLSLESNDNLVSNNSNINIEKIQSQTILNDISFFPENPVTAMALTKWNSSVRVFGIDLTKDLKGLPKIIANSKYNVKIEDIDSKAIYLSGITSSDSAYKVSVEIVRNADNRVASTEFSVKPLLIPYPDYKKQMYPNYTYTIKTNLPKNNKSSAKLYYKDKLITSSNDGSNINFIPQFSDTNKIFKINRYIDNKLIDSKEDIRVISPPQPEITKVNFKDGILYITTKSYGKLKNGNNNIVSKISFNRDNIEYQDLNGSTQYIDTYTIQLFRVKIDANISSLEFYVSDDLGESSAREKVNF